METGRGSAHCRAPARSRFRRQAESALDALKKHLIAREEEDEAGFEVEEQNGVLNVVFEEPAVKFVITPNTPSIEACWPAITVK